MSLVICGVVPQAYELVICAYPVMTTGIVAYPAEVAEVLDATDGAAQQQLLRYIGAAVQRRAREHQQVAYPRVLRAVRSSS